MANPTTNFGWVMPTSTSLVTNLPADFNTFGQGVDTSMAQLKGGTTGQVLSKTSATDMAFTWVTPTDQTPLTTKGDLFAFSTVDARLPVGTNGQVLTADSTATTGLAWATASSGSAYVTGKNIIINGGMDIWQRGTSIACSATAYTADRWQGYRGVAGATVSRQTSSLTLAGIQYCARVQRDSGNTSTSTIWFSQAIETANSYQFANKAIVLSFYARAGANYSAASSALNVRLRWGTGTDQNPLGTWTGGGFTVSSTATLTTSWQRFTFTGTVDATATELAAYVGFDGVGTAGAADYFEMTGVQLEQASSVTDFSRAGATIQGELAACQRYYYLHSTGTGKGVALGTYYSASDMRAYVGLPVTMRTTPTLSAGSGTNYYRIISGGVSTDYFNSFTLEAGYAQTAIIQNSTEVSGTAGYAGIVSCESGTNSFVAFSAEL